MPREATAGGYAYSGTTMPPDLTHASRSASWSGGAATEPSPCVLAMSPGGGAAMMRAFNSVQIQCTLVIEVESIVPDTSNRTIHENVVRANHLVTVEGVIVFGDIAEVVTNEQYLRTDILTRYEILRDLVREKFGTDQLASLEYDMNERLVDGPPPSADKDLVRVGEASVHGGLFYVKPARQVLCESDRGSVVRGRAHAA